MTLPRDMRTSTVLAIGERRVDGLAAPFEKEFSISGVHFAANLGCA